MRLNFLVAGVITFIVVTILAGNLVLKAALPLCLCVFVVPCLAFTSRCRGRGCACEGLFARCPRLGLRRKRSSLFVQGL